MCSGLLVFLQADALQDTALLDRTLGLVLCSRLIQALSLCFQILTHVHEDACIYVPCKSVACCGVNRVGRHVRSSSGAHRHRTDCAETVKQFCCCLIVSEQHNHVSAYSSSSRYSTNVELDEI